MKQLKAHAALIGANLLYGLNYVIAKGIMPDFMSPRGIIFMRAIGAFIVFNLLHILFIKEKVDRKDLIKLAVCSIFGVAINQILFFEGLNLTTPVNASIIITSGPIMVMIFAFFILKERLNFHKILGVALGLTGAVIIILAGGHLSLGSDTFLGNLLVYINISSYGLYLVLVKPLMSKYRPLTVMRWVFNFGLILIFPFCIEPFITTDFSAIPFNIWLSIMYVIIGATILAYLFNVYAMKYVSPVVNSSYMYTQPVIAAVASYFVMGEQLTIVKIISAVLIFSGVYFVSIKKVKL